MDLRFLHSSDLLKNFSESFSDCGEKTSNDLISTWLFVLMLLILELKWIAFYILQRFVELSRKAFSNRGETENK